MSLQQNLILWTSFVWVKRFSFLPLELIQNPNPALVLVLEPVLSGLQRNKLDGEWVLNTEGIGPELSRTQTGPQN